MKAAANLGLRVDHVPDTIDGFPQPQLHHESTSKNKVLRPSSLGNLVRPTMSTANHEVAPVMAAVSPSFFGWNGRAGRIKYLGAVVLGLVVGGLAGGLDKLDPTAPWLWCGIAAIAAMTYVSIVVSVKRCHDLGKSGWFCLLSLVPVVNFAFGIYLLCWPGERGSNRYGAPLQTPEAVDLVPSMDSMSLERDSRPPADRHTVESQQPQTKTSSNTATEIPDDAWAQAYTEFNSPLRRVGLWARAFSGAAGNQAVAQASYLEWRAQELFLEREASLMAGAGTHPPVASAAEGADRELGDQGPVSGHVWMIGIVVSAIVIWVGFALLSAGKSPPVHLESGQLQSAPVAESHPTQADWEHATAQSVPTPPPVPGEGFAAAAAFFSHGPGVLSQSYADMPWKRCLQASEEQIERCFLDRSACGTPTMKVSQLSSKRTTYGTEFVLLVSGSMAQGGAYRYGIACHMSRDGDMISADPVSLRSLR